MKPETARAVANVALASAGVAAAYVVLRNPRLRRMAFRAAQVWLGAGVPALLASQVRSAWLESGTRTHRNVGAGL